ncbi:MAG: phosphoglycerate kinase [Candidatus Chisholmbacteria bacterium]|nr:phosphoglycerate kinase [Candidatus Chisholmbacteria bacterium]
MILRTLEDADISQKTVLFRVDYDTPTQGTGKNKQIADDSRIRLTLPTLNYLLDHHCKIVILAKHGRPNGQVDARFRLDPMAKSLSQLIGKKVVKLNHTIGPEVEKYIATMRPQDIVMLENTRFLPGETTNDPQTAKALAKLGDIIVNDGFSISHRAHASVAGIAQYLPMVAGLHLEKEVKMLSHLLQNPQHPFVVIVGGAKVSDKVAVIDNLSQIADAVLVGGGVANNFLKAQGKKVFKSYLEDIIVDQRKRRLDFVKLAQKLLANPQGQPMLLNGFIPLSKILTPLDVIAATQIKNNIATTTVDLIHPHNNAKLNPKLMYLDIGPKTIKLYREIILQAETIFWNGPMGVFEKKPFERGTFEIASAIARSKALTVLGGGDTLAVIQKFGLSDRYDYVSAAGGAALEFLAGHQLPGLTPMIAK